jgi:hypothetical protein
MFPYIDTDELNKDLQIWNTFYQTNLNIWYHIIISYTFSHGSTSRRIFWINQ